MRATLPREHHSTALTPSCTFRGQVGRSRPLKTKQILSLALAAPALSFAPTFVCSRRQPFISSATHFFSPSDVKSEESTTPFFNHSSSEDAFDVEQRYLRFGGVGRLYAHKESAEKLEPSAASENSFALVDRLSRATVAVVGLGGVGSWAAEALCRSGVGNIILIDMDDICISNTNRQLHAKSSTVGQLKTEAMQRRLIDINPNCNVTTIFDFVTIDNVHEMVDSLLPELTMCLDAIDGSKEKTALIAACSARNVPIVVCGGSAGRTDPTKVSCDDITRANGDRLLSAVRKNLRQGYGFQTGVANSLQKKKNTKQKKWGIHAVFSTETTMAPANGAGKESALRRCDGAYGTACFVTGTFGFVAASRVVDMIAKK